MKCLVPVVEGFAECRSVPVLLRRILGEHLGEYRWEIARPFRVKRTRVAREGEVERAVTQAVRSREGAGCVLILLDADDDCPATLAPGLAERARSVTSLPVSVVLAKRELEAWFLGSKESLRGTRGIRMDARVPPNPEEIRGAKEHLSRNMESRRYLQVDDQPALAASMSLEQARENCPSFDKLLREVKDLVRQMSEQDASGAE